MDENRSNIDESLKNEDGTDFVQSEEDMANEPAAEETVETADAETDAEPAKRSEGEGEGEGDTDADNAEGNTAEGSGSEGNTDGEGTDPATGDTEVADANPASKKAGIFYIVTIALLVVAVVVLVIILVTNNKEVDEEEEAPIPTEAVTEAPADNVIKDSEGNVVTPTPEATEAPAEEVPSTPAWSDDTDYGVTVELAEYKGLKGTIEYSAVSEADIDEELKSFASYHSTLKDVTDRTDIKMGDTVNIDFLGSVDGEPFDGGEGEGYDLEIGSGSFIPGFEEALIGHNNGESFDINVTFPDDYRNTELAGKDATFAITVNSISESIVPEINDALIAENTEYKTVEEYRKHVAEDLLKDRKDQATEDARSNAIRSFVDSCTFGGGIDQEIADYTAYNLELTDQQAQYAYGMDAASLYSYLMGWTKEEYEENMRERCAFSIKYQNALDEIIKKENLTLTTEEYDEFFNSTFIDSYGYESKEAVLEDYTQEDLDKIVNTNALRTKAENLILDSLVLEEKVNAAG
ncbi:MAG: trigger factor [Lachnospiraceae bacterium]|nr:trigger factor [Lachnospiraceae bacterium]